MIDETGPTDTATNPEKRINAKGNAEQWRRHLEKAYFERQRAAMHSRSSAGQPEAETAPGRSTSQSRRSPDNPLVPAANGHGPGVAAKTMPGSSGTPAAPEGAGADRRRVGGATSPFGAATRTHAATSAGQSAGDRAAPVQKVLPRWRGVLPATTSASVLRAEHGAHLVIRDASLSPRAALRLLDRLRMLFAADGERLIAFTLNGELLWQAAGSPGTSVDHAQNIDRNY